MSNLNPFKPSVAPGYDMLAVRSSMVAASGVDVSFFDFGEIADSSPTILLDFGSMANPPTEGTLDLGTIGDSSPYVYLDFGNVTDVAPVTEHNLDLGTI